MGDVMDELSHSKGPGIVTENLTKVYPGGSVRALDSLSVEIGNGEIFGLLGPNGAGKTTTMKMLSTLLLPSSGRAYVDGFDVVKEPNRVREHIGVMLESERTMYWRLTGRENLIRSGVLYHLPRAMARDRVDEVLEEVNLYNYRNMRVGSYSHGMRVKLALARALLPDAPVLLFDEPWAGLDPEAKIETMSLIESLGREDSKTVLVCSHDLQMVERLCHRVAIIQGGKIISAGTPAKLIDDLGGEGSIMVRVNSQSEALKIIDKIGGVVMGGPQGRDAIYLISSDVKGTISSLYDLLNGKIVWMSSSKLALEDVYLAATILKERGYVS